jgi:hypothetical protein
MQEWEYLFLMWYYDYGICVHPAEKFDVEWFTRSFPTWKVGDAHERRWRGEKSRAIPNLSRALYIEPDRKNFFEGVTGAVSMAIIQHVGSLGWEMMGATGRTTSNTMEEGSCWFKRPLAE